MGGGAVALVRDGKRWVWRYQTGPGERTPGGNSFDYAMGAWATIDEFAKKIDRTIDYEDYVLNTLPIPRRREAVMATRAKL
jgi:hypothetical protein